MKDGRCPSCKAVRVFRRQGYGNPIAMPVGIFSTARLDRYTCAACGLVQTYVRDREKLELISRKWEIVPPSHRA